MLKTKNLNINYKQFTPTSAVTDVKLSHVEYRVLSYLVEQEKIGVEWQGKLWREIGDDMSLDRGTVRKCCSKLLETEYLIINLKCKK